MKQLYSKLRVHRWLLAAFLSWLFIPAALGAQAQQRITLDMRRVTIEEAILQIESSSNIGVAFRDGILPTTRRDFNFEDATLEQVMEKLVEGTDLTWSNSGGIVTLNRLAQQPATQVPTHIITGRVVDGNGNPLSGASVTVVDRRIGISTDVQGRFQLTLTNIANPVLRVSFMGHRTVDVPVTGRRNITVTLHEDVAQTETVIVTGYDNVQAKDYVGAVSQVKGEDVLTAGMSSIDAMLQGVIPGMHVREVSGMVGASPRVRVRGTSTILGSQEPVWVVDGVIQHDPKPFNSDDNTSFSVDTDDMRQLAGNAISWLNPNDVETITVLKDASATAIYGSQAANGVIVITTKKAHLGRVRVGYNGDFSVGQRPGYGLYDMMNSAELVKFQHEALGDGVSYANMPLLQGYPGAYYQYINKRISSEQLASEYDRLSRINTDWFDLLFRNSLSSNHSLNISGGSEVVQNNTSLGYTSQRGEARGNDMQTFTASSNTTFNLWSKLVASVQLHGTFRGVDGFGYGVDPFDYAYNTSRSIEAYNPDGSPAFHQRRGSMNIRSLDNGSIFDYNILNEMANTSSRNQTSNWGGALNLNWAITPDLHYAGTFAYSSSLSTTRQWAAEQSWYISQLRGYDYGALPASSPAIEWSPLPKGGVLDTDLSGVHTATARNALTWSKLLGGDHRVSAQLGTEATSVRTQGNAAQQWGFLPYLGETFVNPPMSYLIDEYGSTQTNDQYAYGRANSVNRIDNKLSGYVSGFYTFRDRYIFNTSARVDASNRFGQDRNKRMQPTWSVGGKWRVAEENFIKAQWLDELDLSASYGFQGNAVSGISPYLIARMTTGQGSTPYYYNDMLDIVSLPYPNLGWEKTRSWNLGLSFSLFGGRLGFNGNYYRKVSDVLASREIPFENGLANGVVSGSTMTNRGYDFVVSVTPIRTRDFQWQLSLNTAVARNDIKKNSRLNQLNDYLNGSAIVEGESYSTFCSWNFSGLNPEDGTPMFAGIEEGKASPRDFLVKSGKFTPDFSGGLNTNFRWRNWQFYALFSVQWGGAGRLPALYRYVQYSASNENGGIPEPEGNVSRQLAGRWRRPGDENFTSTPSIPSAFTQRMTIPATGATAALAANSGLNIYDMYNNSSARVASTDFIRCRQISLTYTFGERVLKRLGVANMRVKATMTNPFLWAAEADKWQGIDPETGNWPARRTTSLSLNVQF